MDKTSVVRLACLVAAASELALGGQASAAPRTLEILPGAPGPETARIIDGPIKDSDVYYAGSVIEGTHTSVAGGRGSLAVGLLFGPLGVAANAAHAKEVNVTRGKSVESLASNGTVAVLKTIRETSGQPAAADTRAYALVPSIQILFDDDKTFRLGCTISASLPNPGKRDWRARYSVTTPGQYDASSPASVEQAGQAIAPCLTEANRLFEAHARGGLVMGATPRPAVFNGKTVLAKVVDAEYPAHAVVRDMAGVVEWAVPAPAVPVPLCACNAPIKASSEATASS
jgi:hypothetical protein